MALGEMMPDATPRSPSDLLDRLAVAFNDRLGAVESSLAATCERLNGLEKRIDANDARDQQGSWLRSTLGESVKRPEFWGMVALGLLLAARECGIDTSGIQSIPITTTTTTTETTP